MKRIISLGMIVPSVISILCTVLVLVLVFDVALVHVPVDHEFHFGMMTVNALFGGFLYSNYGMLVGLLDNETIKRLEGTQLIPKRNAVVICGIVCATLSVLCGLYIVLFSQKFGSVLLCWAVNAEIIFMVASMGFYLCSLWEMNTLVNALHKPISKDEEEKLTEQKKELLAGKTSK